MAFVEFHDVKKVYQMGQVRIEALRDVNFEVWREFCVVVALRAGKTTILNILGGMDTLAKARSGWTERRFFLLQQAAMTEYRRFDIGFVFQFYNLVQNLTALENVELAAQILADLHGAVGFGGGGTEGANVQLSGTAFRRRAAEGGNRARLQKIPSCCCVTSRPVRSTTTPARRYSSFCRTPAATAG